jgi:hypothetical protein
VEENQKQFFNTFVLYNPGIKVIEAVGVDKKKEDCHCAWTVKYRHQLKTEDFVDDRLYNYLYTILSNCKLQNLIIQDSVALPGAEDNKQIVVTCDVTCSCPCLKTR